MISPYQQEMRERFLAAPVVPAPAPWRSVWDGCRPVGGLIGVGFGVDPITGHDLVMVVSSNGHGVFDAVTGAKIARDPDPDPETSMPDGPDTSCRGLGPLAGTHVRIAGLYGGGLRTTSGDGWVVQVVAPDWPHHRVLLSADGGLCRGAVVAHLPCGLFGVQSRRVRTVRTDPGRGDQQ